MKLFTTILIIEIIRTLYLDDMAMLRTIIKILGIASIMVIIIFNMNKHQEIGMTIFLVLFFVIAITSFYHGDSTFFVTVDSTFQFTAIAVAVQGAVANRIPKFSHRTAFNMLMILTRWTFIPIADKTLLPIEFVFSFFRIYLDYDREKHDQELFDSHYYSREQLTRFKDLVVSDIPDSILILNQSLTNCLFANNAFSKLFEGTFETNISARLEKFKIQESLSENSVISERSSSPIHRQTLSTFIRNYLKQEGSQITLSKTSCTVSYFKTIDADAKNSFDQIQNPPELSFEVKILPLYWDGKPAIGIILHDVTQQNTILRLKIAANIQKDRVLATVSHELRTPLNSMLGMIQIMQQLTQDIDLTRYLTICSNSGYLLLGLVNSILDLNMIKANKLKLYTQEIRLREFLEDILRLFEFQCNQKKIFLKLTISPLLPKLITTDKNRLGQIFLNLIGNALKFTQKGGITITVEPFSRNKNFMAVHVEDTGLGIKEEDKGRLFRMFGRLDHQETIVNTQGVGLGLTISNNLAKLLCSNKDLGGIQVESEWTKGSRFSFVVDKNLDLSGKEDDETGEGLSCDFSLSYLDEGDFENKNVSNYRSSLSTAKKSLNFDISSIGISSLSKLEKNPFLNKRTHKPYSLSQPPSPRASILMKFEKAPIVLIVDDNPLNIEVAEFFIKRHQVQIRTALSGQEALDMVLEHNYSVAPIKLILMDLQMPIMDGYQASKELKELMNRGKVPRIPIIALTANSSEVDKKACFKVGMVDHLSKPLDEEDLKRVMEKYVV